MSEGSPEIISSLDNNEPLRAIQGHVNDRLSLNSLILVASRKATGDKAVFLRVPVLV